MKDMDFGEGALLPLTAKDTQKEHDIEWIIEQTIGVINNLQFSLDRYKRKLEEIRSLPTNKGE